MYNIYIDSIHFVYNFGHEASYFRVQHGFGHYTFKMIFACNISSDSRHHILYNIGSNILYFRMLYKFEQMYSCNICSDITHFRM